MVFANKTDRYPLINESIVKDHHLWFADRICFDKENIDEKERNEPI